MIYLSIFFCENMLFFKLIYLYNVDMRKNTVAIYIASGLWTVGPHPVSLAAQPLTRFTHPGPDS